MGRGHAKGFTIIEAVLFIAISGLLMMLLLVGWNVSMNTQQYRDSARSLSVFLQQQYTGLTDVVNEREINKNCSILGGTVAIVDDNSSDPHSPGQSNCVILGKYIYITGDKVTVNMVIGKKDFDAGAGSDIDKTFKNTGALVVKAEDSKAIEYAVPWTPRLTRQGDPLATASTNTAFIVVVLRSPVSGLAYTKWRVDDNATNDLSRDGFFEGTAATSTGAFAICLHPEMTVSGEAQAVRIGANASSANAVQVLTSGSGCTL